ncbi:hypothetical protein DFJ74DRAFT_685569 [Hyaloraphidium curvatum]|nr:hypothetical protein DFJ74DRAFT_685569 [Hyaloraphidium curvatum]
MGDGTKNCLNRARVVVPRAGIDYTEDLLCPGPCPFDNIKYDSRWVWEGPDKGVLNNARLENDATCPGLFARGSKCVASSSDGCSYIGVRTQQTSFGPNVICQGAELGTCTWYSDPNCNYIKPPGLPPTFDNGVNCQNFQGSDPLKWTGWCREVFENQFLNVPSKCGVPPPPPPPTTRTCARSCSNNGNYISVVVLDWRERVIKCDGPDSGTCTWYADPNCDIIVPPGRPPVSGQGVTCPPRPEQNAPGSWCAEATYQVIDGALPEENCGAVTPSECWLCINSCADAGGDFFWGKRTDTGGVACCGPDPNTCSWYYDSACTVIKPPGKAPVAGQGVKCPQNQAGGSGSWCARAANVFNSGAPYQEVCR